jgi:hypothetical protein
MAHRSPALVSMLALVACASDDAWVPEPMPSELAVGEARELELRYLRLDVEGYEKTHTLADLRAMPRRVLQDIWLLDLDVAPLMTNSLAQMAQMSDQDAAMQPQAAQNMRKLLNMTPDNAVLEGTNLEALIDLSAAVGIPPAHALANLLSRGVTDEFCTPDFVAEVMLENVIGTHPNAILRKGPVDDAHPDGLYPVAPRSLPVTLADVVTNFEDMADRFGATGDHPGFVAAAHGVTVIEDSFAMKSKVNANALPFKGVDASIADVASVNSIAGQIETLHDFDDPDWIVMEGLVPDPRVEELTFRVLENDAFMPGGTTMEPAPNGGSPAWDLPPWEFEHLIAEMAQREIATIPAHCDAYQLGTGVDAFTACIDETGWVVLETFNDVGSPPAPAYLWDLDLEIAQVRLHDGGLAEGEADVEITLRDIEVGVPADVIVEQVKTNIQANPEALAEFASLITDSTVGEADFYYVRLDESAPASQQGDWLFFVGEADIALDDEGGPVRPYAYASPGFFADAELSSKVSTTENVDGDVEHEKVQIEPGATVYIGDDGGRVFRIEVGDKPSRARIALRVTRLE